MKFKIMTTETTFSNQMEIRNQISDLVCSIDIAELTVDEKIEAINFALDMLTNLKIELK